MNESTSSARFSFNVYFEIKYLFNESIKVEIFADIALAKDFIKSASSKDYKILTICCYFQATSGENNAGMVKIPAKRFAEVTFDEDEFLKISQNLIESLWGEAERQIDDYMSKEYFEGSQESING